MSEEFLNKSTKEEIIDMLVSQIDYTRELQNNWNELKKFVEEEKGQWGKDNSCWFESVLDKMQDLEQGKDE